MREPVTSETCDAQSARTASTPSRLVPDIKPIKSKAASARLARAVEGDAYAFQQSQLSAQWSRR